MLHAAVSLGCRMVGMADDLLLTLLTMLMVVILCLRRATNVVFMSTAVILANIVGFGLGKGPAGRRSRMCAGATPRGCAGC